MLIITNALKVAASFGVKVRQTSWLWPGARMPDPAPELISKPATCVQSMYIASMLLEQLATLMLLMDTGAPLVLVIVKQSGPAVPPRRTEEKLM